jgi:hypothetical protein
MKMVELTPRRRARLPARDFAGPNRSFPINDKAHVRTALAYLGKSNLTRKQKATAERRIRARARRFDMPSGYAKPKYYRRK